jgi:hypothetical protein
VIDHKTVRRVEEGRACKHDSRDSNEIVAQPEGPAEVIDGSEPDLDALLADLEPVSADDGHVA